MTTSYDVDVIIAVHQPQRPIARAVESVVAGTRARVRVTVVCHNTPADGIAQVLGALADHPQVKLVELWDGIPSPSGPFNYGLDHAEAPFAAIMGSDDSVEPGAIDSWLSLLKSSNAEMVVTRLERMGSTVVSTPAARPLRRRGLDAVRDRLSYRSAPLGLMRVSMIRRLNLRLVGGMAVGGDVAFVTQMWFQARKIAFDRYGPGYRIGADAEDRVTEVIRPLAAELRYVPNLLDRKWFHSFTGTQKRAVAVKVTRIHLFGAVHNRPKLDFWTPTERADLRDITRTLLECAPGFERVLSRAERDLLDAIVDVQISAQELLARSVRRRRHGRLATVVTRDLRKLLAREAPLRFMAASFIGTVRLRRFW